LLSRMTTYGSRLSMQRSISIQQQWPNQACCTERSKTVVWVMILNQLRVASACGSSLRVICNYSFFERLKS
jgi:hypothetical protein